MSSSPQALPRYRKPPVVETVLAVHFRPLEEFTSAHQGLLWDRFFRNRFPKLEERPLAEELQERFGDDRLRTPMLRWQVFDRPPTPRLWAASESGENVIQIQKNAFFANWLKTSDDLAYRPYAVRREEFSEQLSQVERFLRDEGVGQLEPTTWSVTYINHIGYEGLHEIGRATARTMEAWSNKRSDTWLPEPDKVTLDFSFPMADDTGRLNVNMAPAVLLSDKRQILRLDLTARGQLKLKDLTGALAGIDFGHEWIVRRLCLANDARNAQTLGEVSMSKQYTISGDWLETTGQVHSNWPVGRCDWLEDAARQFHAIARLPHGWDSYGSPPPDTRKMNFAWSFLTSLCGVEEFPKPHVNPLPNGGIQFDWENGQRYFEIVIESESDIRYLFCDDGAAVQEEGDLAEVGPQKLITYIRRVTGQPRRDRRWSKSFVASEEQAVLVG